MSKITNTSKNHNPEWLLGGNPGAIENQEAKGQEELVNADVLPTRIEGGGKKILRGFGVSFGRYLKKMMRTHFFRKLLSLKDGN